MKVPRSVRVGAASLLTATILAGCGVASSKAAASTPPSKTSQAPATVTVTHTVRPPTPTGIGAFSPTAPTNISTPVPLTIQGASTAKAGLSSITFGYNFATYYQWNLFSLTLWVFGNPEGSYTMLYWNANNNGTYTFQFPMALANTTVRVIAQFVGPHGQIVTEYGPEFTVR